MVNSSAQLPVTCSRKPAAVETSPRESAPANPPGPTTEATAALEYRSEAVVNRFAAQPWWVDAASGSGVPKDDPSIGDHSPDPSYFLDVYLRDTRAAVHPAHPYWNSKTVAQTRLSIAGQQSLTTAGLNPGEVRR